MQSYDDILKSMTDKYTQLTQSKIHPESDIYIRMQVLAGEIYSALVYVQWVKKQMFSQTADNIYLDYHAETRGLKRKSATKSCGKVTFYVNEEKDNNITIESGTIVSTDEIEPVRFETTQDAILEAGELSVTVPVTAYIEGSKSNVNSNTVTVMVTPPTGIDYVKNSAAIENGSDEESDDSLRRRILDTYKFVSNSTNAAYYKSLALQVDGVEFAGVISRNRGNGTIDIYISQKNAAATQQQIDNVSQIVNAEREINTDVKVYSASALNYTLSANISVKDGYSFTSVQNQCTAKVTEYINSRGIGVPVLLSEISDIIYHIDGIKNYTFSSLCSDAFPTQAQYCTAATVYFGEADE